MVVAKAFNLQVGIPESVVMAKYLYSREDLAQAAFRDELEMYSKTSHIRFSRLIGLSREVEPILAVFEYTEWVSIKCGIVLTCTLIIQLQDGKCSKLVICDLTAIVACKLYLKN